MRVTHVITELGSGGVAAMLYKLILATRRELGHSVVSLTTGGVVGPRLSAEGISVTCLEMRPGVPNPIAAVRLARLLGRDRPDLVQSWMYHADLLAGIAAAWARVPVVWGIHHSDVEPRNVKRVTRWTRLLCARLSSALPTRIVCCAQSALDSHRGLGYCADRMSVIPNGFDVRQFSASPEAGARFREELSIPSGAPVVGLVARFHPDKDHETFLCAARLVAQRRADAIFVLAGKDVEWTNRALSSRIDDLGLRARMRLLGPRRDVPALLSALDVLASSSRSEAFPQILGEAMLCGVPCAVTACGDSREIVGETGRAVSPRDPEALAEAILDLLALAPNERAALGAEGRERVCRRYDIRVVAGQYAALYADVVATHAGPRRGLDTDAPGRWLPTSVSREAPRDR